MEIEIPIIIIQQNMINSRLPYADIFGGVSAMSREQFRLVNGFSNVYWGWGGEDDDMANRIKAHNLHISRYPSNIARYKMLTHKKEKANPKRSVEPRVLSLCVDDFDL